MREPTVRIRVLDRRSVEDLLDPDALRAAIARAMVDVSRGRVSMPNRVAALVDERNGFLGVMPAFLPSAGALATKLVTLFPNNLDRPTHQGVLICFDPETGTPTALMDATSITAARTAAGSALSTDLLARADARTLAVLGTGVQARSHAVAVVRVRSFERVLVAGRTRDSAELLAADVGAEVGVPCEVLTTFEDACRSADVVCATTHADHPVVRRAWLRPGTHIASVGFNSAGEGEVDEDTVAASALFVESRAAALADPPSGAIELVRAIERGIIAATHVRAEIGEVVAGTAPGRTSEDEITLYKSVGIAAQDAAAAALVLDVARETGTGIEIGL